MGSNLFRKLIQSTWLTSIAIALLAGFNFLVAAVRDFLMAIASLSTARIAKFMIL